MLVKVYGTEAVNKKCVYDWFKRFRDGKEAVDDEPCSRVDRQQAEHPTSWNEWDRCLRNLLQDNARPHTAIRMLTFVAKRSVTVLEHPPYSPDMTPADFFLFPRLKGVLKGLHFADVPDIQKRVTSLLRAIPQEAFAECFQQLYNRCQKCIVTNGDYFEGQ
ncbi:Histone-lysine N-methyltransferase SETMAR [Dufourea novaeangliae]|uniref:Histone-lysine N-methyltransferase SETMAR n=1 Tax=Dufourea novaeangliae TaxID=178035 RepID=A0A154P9Z8_DUFNO|nr:Histone-lysine N-methyltransferase SETMAR [Dufourea novaeangliae]